MKNKIIGILGVLFILFSIGAFFAYSNSIKNNSELFGKSVIVLSKDIKAGETLTSDNMTLKKIRIDDIQTGYLTESDINSLKDKVAAIDLYKNEQLNMDRLTTKDAFDPVSSQYVSLDITAINALSGDIQVNDIVSLWSKPENGTPSKELDNVRIIAIRDAQNQEVNKSSQTSSNNVPTSIIVKLDNDNDVKTAKAIKTLFVTKNLNQLQEKLDSETNTTSTSTISK